jgi:hydroxyethylthiazole kinase-like uncharacterized protein yjeF
MLAVLSRGEMAEVDARAVAAVGLEELVARAGHAVGVAALDLLGSSYGKRVVVLAGGGNNGADGRTGARLLARRGVRVMIVELSRSSSPPRQLPPCDLVIDAAFGTGFRGSYSAPEPPAGAAVLAVDLPSGVDADTGFAAAGAVRASATITLGALKPGLLFGGGRELTGRLRLARIGLDTSGATVHLIEDADLDGVLPVRRRGDHKWSAAVYLVAGGLGTEGAGSLASLGCLRAGSGMVRLLRPGPLGEAGGAGPGSFSLGSSGPSDPLEVVRRHLPAGGDLPETVLADLGASRALVLGPGAGTTETLAQALRELVSRAPLPLVLDADGLSALGGLDQAASVLGSRSHATVLTPHDGEYARLTGEKVPADRLGAARALSARLSSVVLLKGSTTTVAAPDGRALVVTAGSERLATAGTGDVLSGVIGAFVARGIDPFAAAALAAHVHGRAASRSPVDALVASDLPRLIAEELMAASARAGLDPIGSLEVEH